VTYVAARALRDKGDLAGALRLTGEALARAPDDPSTLLLFIELSAALGRGNEVRATLCALAERPDLPLALRRQAAQLLTHFSLHGEAERCNARCLAEAPDDPQVLYNWAAALTAVGRLSEAEQAYDRVVALAPHDSDAWYNRATLRRQTPTRNHVTDLEAQLRDTAAGESGRVGLEYALAKELEDLGQYPRAFAALKRGADLRRRRLSYRVAADTEAMAEIARTFSTAWRASRGPGDPDARPVFIVGLPRSGTTLIDRILSSHSGIVSRGESTDLAAAVMHCAAPARGKSELIRHAGHIDPAHLGAEYCRRLPPGAALRVVDKTPLNFLYLGLIHAALPSATLIHVRREPLDVCYAMYKTLFRMAYPCSYSLEDLAQYYIAYDRLMAHWRRLLPGALCEVDYEELISSQESVSRRLIAHCRLDWQPEVLHFERNAAPTLTASAAQVREPLYPTSIGLWRHYAIELGPLREQLAAANIETRECH
jgi:tetratricopeptide (TPR) repeat protein